MGWRAEATLHKSIVANEPLIGERSGARWIVPEQQLWPGNCGGLEINFSPFMPRHPRRAHPCNFVITFPDPVAT
jgi:hypothetical protein